MLLPARTGFAPLTAPWARDRLHTLLHIEEGGDVGSGRVVVSRADSARRSLVNEAELLRHLDPYGFRLVRLLDHAPRDQVRLFIDAEVVVGLHGSGLAHAAYARPRALLAEIGLDGQVHPEYAGIAHLAGLDYVLVPAQQTLPDRPTVLADHSAPAHRVAHEISAWLLGRQTNVS